MRDLTAIFTAALFTALILGIQHYAILPYYRAGVRRDMPILMRYVIGVLAILAPSFVLFSVWGTLSANDAILALSLITAIGGLAVFCFYGLDHLFTQISLRRDKRQTR